MYQGVLMDEIWVPVINHTLTLRGGNYVQGDTVIQSGTTQSKIIQI
jgi:hypothetical protein